MKTIFLLTVLILSTIFLFGQTQGNLDVTVTTSSAGGNFAPRHVMAIWVENSSGEFVKTLLEYGDKRKTHLNNWQEVTSNAGYEFNKTDAITGATQTNHKTRNCSWNSTNFSGDLLEDGNYKLCMELTDKNQTGNFSSFDFVKSNELYTLNPENQPSFSSINIAWTPEQTTTDIISLKDNLKVYPTTTAGLLHISGQNIESITISNTKGEIMYYGISLQPNISNLPSGIYIIQIKTKNQIISQKIIKN